MHSIGCGTLLALVLACTMQALAATPQLGPAPRFAANQAAIAGKSALPPVDRASVVAAYYGLYVPAASVVSGWNGNVAACQPGSVSSAYQNATLDRINYARLLAGLPDNVAAFTGPRQENAQAAALMMSAQNALSHTPPASWACYSSGGATGAGNSNLAIGYPGISAIDGYMQETGSGNFSVGHRRWLLYPPQNHVGIGFVQGGARPAHALWVLGPFGTRPATPGGVAWPPRGFVPYQLLPNQSNRWSFSYPNANFSAAQVSISVAGTPLPAPVYEPIANGYGDNTLVWRPNGVSYTAPASDTAYRVTITGVSGSGVPTSFQYDVIVIDPATTPPPPQTLFRDGFE